MTTPTIINNNLNNTLIPHENNALITLSSEMEMANCMHKPDIHLIFGSRFMQAVYLDNPLFTPEIPPYDRTAHALSLGMDYNVYAMRYKVPQILAAVHGDWTQQFGDENVNRYSIVGILRSICPVSTTKAVFSSALHGDVFGDSWHLHVAVTHMSSSGERLVCNNTEINSGRFLINGLVDYLAIEGLVPFELANNLTRDVTCKIRQGNEPRVSSLIAYIHGREHENASVYPLTTRLWNANNDPDNDNFESSPVLSHWNCYSADNLSNLARWLIDAANKVQTFKFGTTEVQRYMLNRFDFDREFNHRTDVSSSVILMERYNNMFLMLPAEVKKEVAMWFKFAISKPYQNHFYVDLKQIIPRLTNKDLWTSPTFENFAPNCSRDNRRRRIILWKNVFGTMYQISLVTIEKNKTCPTQINIIDGFPASLDNKIRIANALASSTRTANNFILPRFSGIAGSNNQGILPSLMSRSPGAPITYRTTDPVLTIPADTKFWKKISAAKLTDCTRNAPLTLLLEKRLFRDRLYPETTRVRRIKGTGRRNRRRLTTRRHPIALRPLPIGPPAVVMRRFEDPIYNQDLLDELGSADLRRPPFNWHRESIHNSRASESDDQNNSSNSQSFTVSENFNPYDFFEEDEIERERQRLNDEEDEINRQLEGSFTEEMNERLRREEAPTESSIRRWNEELQRRWEENHRRFEEERLEMLRQLDLGMAWRADSEDGQNEPNEPNPVAIEAHFRPRPIANDNSFETFFRSLVALRVFQPTERADQLRVKILRILQTIPGRQFRHASQEEIAIMERVLRESNINIQGRLNLGEIYNETRSVRIRRNLDRPHQRQSNRPGLNIDEFQDTETVINYERYRADETPEQRIARLQRFRRRNNNLRGGMPRRRPTPPSGSTESSTMVQSLKNEVALMSEKPQNWLDWVTAARKSGLTEIADPAKQLTYTSHVKKLMFEQNCTDIDEWICAYVFFSKAFPTSNTYNTFETAIKSIKAIIPEISKLENYKQWCKKQIIVDNLTMDMIKDEWLKTIQTRPDLETLANTFLTNLQETRLYEKLESWVLSQFLPSWTTDKHPPERQALLLTGPSSVGKSLFINTLFMPFKSCNLNLAAKNKYQESEVYDPKYDFWYIRDLNDVNKEKLILLQNILSDSVKLESKYAANSSKQKNKPIIICCATGVDADPDEIWYKFGELLNHSELDYTQLKKRIHHIHLKEAAKATGNQQMPYTSILLQFAEAPALLFNKRLLSIVIDKFWTLMFSKFEKSQKEFQTKALETFNSIGDITKNDNIKLALEQVGITCRLPKPKDPTPIESTCKMIITLIPSLVVLGKIINSRFELKMLTPEIIDFLAKFAPNTLKETKAGVIHFFKAKIYQKLNLSLHAVTKQTRSQLYHYIAAQKCVFLKTIAEIKSTPPSELFLPNWSFENTSDPRFLLLCDLITEAKINIGNCPTVESFIIQVKTSVENTNAEYFKEEAINDMENWFKEIKRIISNSLELQKTRSKKIQKLREKNHPGKTKPNHSISNTHSIFFQSLEANKKNNAEINEAIEKDNITSHFTEELKTIIAKERESEFRDRMAKFEKDEEDEQIQFPVQEKQEKLVLKDLGNEDSEELDFSDSKDNNEHQGQTDS